MKISFVNSEKMFTVKSKTFHCDHPNIEIDMDFRSVRCAKCGSGIDAFDFILSLSQNETMYESRINNLKREIKELESKKRLFK